MLEWLVISDGGFETIRFRHSGLESEEVVQASFRVLEYVPKVGELVERFRFRKLEPEEALLLASHAWVMRYGSLADAPVEPQTLLQPRRPEDASSDVWSCINRVQESIIRGRKPRP